MSDIIKTRRVTILKRYEDWEVRTIRNPLFNERDFQEAMYRGLHYPFLEFIEKEYPVQKTLKRTHIEYLKVCQFCKSEQWVRRRDAKYCSDGCRKLGNKAAGE